MKTPRVDGAATLVARIFAEPRRIAALDAPAVDLLLQQLQQCGLAGRMAARLRAGDLLDQLPPRARHVLAMAEVRTDKHRRQAEWEARCMEVVLRGLEQPLILLKGGAYVLAGLEAGRGRVLSDIDILVPHERLGAVEGAFFRNGWLHMKADEYDDRYYREWSHELPPMQHIRRQTVVDIHHTILPPTARYTVEGAKLLSGARPIPGHPGMMTLQPMDMVLHNIVHLFADGAMENGLRDLVDLQSLLREFRDSAGFWRQLLSRAEELGIGRPLYFALDAVSRILEFPVPMEVMAELEPHAPVTMPLLRPMFAHCLRPYHVRAEGPVVAAARFAVYIRSHYLRMPFSMLIPHLTRKAVRRWKEGEEAAA